MQGDVEGVPWTLKRVRGMLQVGPRGCREGTMEDLAQGPGGGCLSERVGVWPLSSDSI